jgi:hypothetical protein
VIAEMSQVTDPEQYKQYMAEAPAAIKAFGGEYLVRGGRHEPCSKATGSRTRGDAALSELRAGQGVLRQPAVREPPRQARGRRSTST